MAEPISLHYSDRLGSPNPSLFERLLGELPYEVQLWQPLLNQEGYIADFRLAYSNRQPADRSQAPTNASKPGVKLSSLYPSLLQDISDLGKVLQDSKPISLEYIDATLQRIIRLRASSFEGYLVTAVEGVKQVGQQVQEQADKLRVLCDTAPWGILMLEPLIATDGTVRDFRLRLANRMCAKLARKTVEQMEGQPLGELVPTFLPASFMETLRQVCQSGLEQRTTFCYQEGGQNTWFDCSFMPYKEGVLVTLLDISALKESQLVEQQTASLLQHILDSSLTAIVLVDPLHDEQGGIVDFSCRMANEAFIKASRQPLQAIIGQTMLTIHPHLKGSETLQRYFDVAQTGQPQQFEQLMPTRHGAMWLSVSVVRQGHGLVISFLDITPLKTYQQQLQELVGQLEHSNQQLEQFASVASHDMQEPLRKIQSFGSILLNDYGEVLPERGQDFLRRMQQAAARMQQLVKDLLTYSQLSTQQSPVNHVDLNHVLAEALTDLELTIEEKAAQVQREPLPTILGNAFQLRQVFFNLVGNALKFHQPGLAPVVVISSEQIAPHQVPASLKSKYPGLPVSLITVADKGIGFEDHYKDRIFKPFQRLHGHSQYAGTGIGLAICRQVVEGHGGTLEVQSKPGEGTTFFIYLPLKS